MQSGIKILTVVIAAALIVVIGLIMMFTFTQKTQEDTEANTNVSTTQRTAVNGADSASTVANGGEQSSPDGADAQAQNDDAQDEPMYEGALAGMTEEEIAQLALAEEQNHNEGESND